MSTIVILPGLETCKPWEPPLPPFQWRSVSTGQVKCEFLVDARGRQLFRQNSAICRVVGTKQVQGLTDAEPDGNAK